MYVCVYTSNKGLDNIAEIERKMEQKKREAQRAKQGDEGDEADDESESDSFFESERDDEGDGPQRGKKKKRSWGDVILDPNTYWLTFVPHERSLSLSQYIHTHTHTHTHTHVYIYIKSCLGHISNDAGHRCPTFVHNLRIRHHLPQEQRDWVQRPVVQDVSLNKSLN